MQDMPLYQALLAYRSKEYAPFHTPGHAGRAIPAELFSLDFTELPDTDSLYEADGPILEAEKAAARLFGVPRTLFSAGGCTLCIQTMLRLAAPQGGKIICGRVIHRSAIHTMALLGLEPVWVYPRADAGPGLPGRVCAGDVETALRCTPDARAVYLTSPDYYGVMADIEAISAVCKKYGVPLLVDNAHGTHLKFLSRDRHPTTLGASMTACSAHKTLPVLTGGAWLNIADERFVSGAKGAMSLFGSTSPSYLVMASLDWARAWVEKNAAQAYPVLEQRVRRIREIAAERGIRGPEGECDPTRIALDLAGVGMTGEQGAALFRTHGVEPEYADQGYLVLIATPFHTEEDFRRVEEAVRAVPLGKPIERDGLLPPALPEAVMTPRDAVLGLCEEIPLEKAAGRIAAEPACPCPPGVPVVMPGEKITLEIVKFLIRYGFFSAKVLKC